MNVNAKLDMLEKKIAEQLHVETGVICPAGDGWVLIVGKKRFFHDTQDGAVSHYHELSPDGHIVVIDV